MTAKEIAQLIARPESLSSADFTEIEKLASKYPYAQTFPLLLLQHLGKTKAFDFDENLNKFAYRITDRAQLYFLINEGTPVDKTVVPEPIADTKVEMTIVPDESEVIETTEEISEEKIAEASTLKNVDNEPKEEAPEISTEPETIAESPVEDKIPEQTDYEPADGIRTALDINPDEDMSDFRVVEVQEMTFDPVTIDFDDDEIKALDFEPLIDNTSDLEVETENPIETVELPREETIIEPTNETEPEELVVESAPKLPEEIIEEPVIEIVEKEIPVETITEENVVEPTPELPKEIIEELVIESVEAEIPVEPTPEEVVEEAQTEAIEQEIIEEKFEGISPEETSIEQETILADELVESTVEIEPEPVTETIEETPAEAEIEEVEDETIIHYSEMKPMEFFDPTADLFAEETEKEVAEIQPSAFEQESQAISFEEEVEEENTAVATERDEFTSNAIVAGYQLTEEEPIQKPESLKEKETNEVVQEFEDKIAAKKRSFTDWLKVSTTTHSEEYQVKEQRTEEIMDRFIKDDPKITRIPKSEVPEKKVVEFFKVSTIAKESLNEQVMPVSETLAHIYEQQANFTKAIDAYEQLMLLFPEKKSFFANQIKKLKQKIKN